MLVFFRVPRMLFHSQPNHYLIFLGILLLLLKSGTSQSDSVSQNQNHMEILEGKDATLPCNFITSSSSPYLFWYRQYGNQVPERILSADKYSSEDNTFQEGKFSTTLVFEDQNLVPLNIRRVSLIDEAVYFCALTHSSGVDKVYFGSGTRLIVMPNLRNSTPSVYQLETKENLTACLITDYSPNSIKVKDHNNMKTVDGSVVVVKDDHENPTSLGAVIWRQKKDQFQCSVEHSGLNYKAENEGDGCSETQSSTPVFETDERLNLLSLTVLGLRLIFFKSVALNLILTFWAWSR